MKSEARELYSTIFSTQFEEVNNEEIMPYVRIYSSETVGAGKSHMVKRWAEKHEAKLVRVPVNSIRVRPQFIIDRLNMGAKPKVIPDEDTPEQKIVEVDCQLGKDEKTAK